jgi:hypothetical protein
MSALWSVAWGLSLRSFAFTDRIIGRELKELAAGRDGGHLRWLGNSSNVPVVSGGTFLSGGETFVAIADSCGRWRVDDRESRRADIAGLMLFFI